MKQFAKSLGAIMVALAIMFTFVPALPVYANPDWDDNNLNTFDFSRYSRIEFDFDYPEQEAKWNFQIGLLDDLAADGTITRRLESEGVRYYIDGDDIWDIDTIDWENGTHALNLNPYSELHGHSPLILESDYFAENGLSNYDGKVHFFAYPKPDINNGSVYIVFKDTWYTGNARKPDFEVREEDVTSSEPYAYNVLEKGKDYTVYSWNSNVDAGQGTLTIKGKGRFSGSMSAKFTIKPRSLGSSLITWKLSYTNYTWNGKAKTPSVTGTMNGNSVDKSKTNGYTAEYKYNTNVGQASVVLTGHGNYTGTKTLHYNIKPKPTTIYSLAGDKGSFTVKWYKRTEKMSTSQITGYLIQYSKKSDFSTKTNVWVPLKSKSGAYNYSKKVTGLKSGTYYVRICTYKTINYSSGKKTFYSYWRPYKNTVKVK